MGQEGRDGSSVPERRAFPADRSFLRRLLERHGLDADKRFGQHYLVSERVVNSILKEAEDAVSIVEIGPGVGALTAHLAESAQKTVAIELDTRVLGALKEVAPKAEIVEGDILKTDLNKILQDLPEPRCVVSNMPYNITGPLLTKIAESNEHYRNAVLMMQKEVGTRILAKTGDREKGSLSVFLQLQFDIKKVCDASAGCFLPPPKVASVVLNFIPKKEKHDKKVFKLIRNGFVQPRKTLANNLSSSYKKEHLKEVLDTLNLKHNVRPHQLENAQWVALAEKLL